jgi:hypothetical protein
MRLGGPQGRSRKVRKILPPQGFDPRTVQTAASRLVLTLVVKMIWRILDVYRLQFIMSFTSRILQTWLSHLQRSSYQYTLRNRLKLEFSISAGTLRSRKAVISAETSRTRHPTARSNMQEDWTRMATALWDPPASACSRLCSVRSVSFICEPWIEFLAYRVVPQAVMQFGKHHTSNTSYCSYRQRRLWSYHLFCGDCTDFVAISLALRWCHCGDITYFMLMSLCCDIIYCVVTPLTLWRYHLLYVDVTLWWYHLLCDEVTFWWYHLLCGDRNL